MPVEHKKSIFYDIYDIKIFIFYSIYVIKKGFFARIPEQAFGLEKLCRYYYPMVQRLKKRQKNE
jgi:hypothetical protein